MPKFNPFRPNGIVTTGMFAGRWDQMLAIEQSLFQTKNENPRNFIVLGERGIGKSSLLFAVDMNAKGLLEVTEGTKFNFLVIQSELVSATSFDDLVTTIGTEFKAAVGRRHAIKTFATKAFDFITNWKVMGIEYKKGEQGTSNILLIDGLAEAIAAFLENVRDDLDGTRISFNNLLIALLPRTTTTTSLSMTSVWGRTRQMGPLTSLATVIFLNFTMIRSALKIIAVC